MVCFRVASVVSAVVCAQALQIPSGMVDFGSEQPLKTAELPATQGVYSIVKRQAVELQNAIERQEDMSLHEMHSRRAMLAKRLVMQQKVIEADELIKNATQDQLRSVRREIEKLRGEADGLARENEALTKQLKGMRKNISTALEFVNASVLYAVQRTGADPNLEILHELRQQDEKHAHSQEVNDFARLASLSMLITGNVTKSVAKTPEEFVSILRNNLGEAVAERNASLAELDMTFRRLYSQGKQKHAWLLRMQDKLNQSLSEDTVTKDRLEQAVHHLKVSKELLSDNIEALRRFGRERLGEKVPQPATSAVQRARGPVQNQGPVHVERETPNVAEDSSMDDGPQSDSGDPQQGETS